MKSVDGKTEYVEPLWLEDGARVWAVLERSDQGAVTLTPVVAVAVHGDMARVVSQKHKISRMMRLSYLLVDSKSKYAEIEISSVMPDVTA